MSGTPLALECRALTKRFGGLEAVRRIDLRVQSGERRAVIGPNGAGKTTLFRLISGEFPASAGSIALLGQEVTRVPSHRRAALGLGRTFQITNLFPSMTVADNLVTAAMALRPTKYMMLRPLSAYGALYALAEGLLETVGMSAKRDTPLRSLSHGEQRQIEIAMALVGNPRVLLLDEPTAGLSAAESMLMTRALKTLDPRMTILIIEHDMEVALSVADRVTVLHQGSCFVEGTPAEIRANAGVQEIYFGAEG